MRLRGSVLIVVLGLLAILAVVGITFVTMSSIDTSTAANFALQAQFDLAADGAVDYVRHALAQDLWEFDAGTPITPTPATGATYRTYTGRLLTGLLGTEYYDFPQSGTPSATTPDTWLATNWVSSSAPTGATYSFCTASAVTLFNLTNFGGYTVTSGAGDLDGHPNNLGIPTGTVVKWNSPANGLWIPDLAFPYETGVIRVSVTVQDHGAMVNLNAHGNGSRQDNEVAQKWPYVAAQGKGYFVSDVNPVVTGFLVGLDLKKLVLGDSSGVPGRWSKNSGPGIKATGEILIQNPFAKGDRPYTLDEEFELRRLTGTNATTRLESFAGTGLTCSPATGTTSVQVANRLSLTTEGWAAEVRPYPLPTTNPTTIAPGTHDASLQLKADLNFDDPNVIRAALVDGRAFNATASPKTLDQFIANICAFRKRTPSWVAFNNVYGARRQPFFTKAKGTPSSGGSAKWALQLEVFNPWPGDQAGDTGGITWGLWKVVIKCKDPQPIVANATTITIVIKKTGPTAPAKWEPKTAVVVEKTSSTDPSDTSAKPLTIEGISTSDFKTEVLEIRIEAFAGGPTQGVDKIDPSVVVAGWRRKVGVYEEMRDNSTDTASLNAITVLYVKDLATGDPLGTLSFGTVNAQEIVKGDGIPIRFPHSVPDITEYNPKDTDKGPLPPYATEGKFKAFLRIGDLNQVLCPGGTNAETEAAIFWPWIGRIASKSIGVTAPTEATVKFDWNDTIAAPGDPTTYTRMKAANVLTTVSPWQDSYDNDGDGTKDQGTGTGYDLGTDTQGRFCGPEIRVAGKINLNTATDKTLDAIDTSLGTGGAIKAVVKTLRGIGPITSIAQLVGQITPGSGDTLEPVLWGPLEKRDHWFTRISNIATVRSDTFSIYGTVQYVQPPTTAGAAPARIIKTRRFWALVDRSPSVAFSPVASSNRFLHPRIVNFQWMD